VRFLEIFKSTYYADISLKHWLAPHLPNWLRRTLSVILRHSRPSHKEKFPVVSI
jgi:oxalate decarboxylase